MSEAPLLSFEKVSFGYAGASPLIENASFSVPKGRAVCIVGPNGCGKTTLCRLMLGLLKPTRGHIQVLGTRPELARQWIGYLPQTVAVDPLFPATVMDVVLTGRLKRFSLFGYSRRDREAARDALASMGMAEVADKPFAALSGGQQRRVLIARALAGEPRLLLMDEPTANVDPAAEDALLDRLQQMQREVPVVLVSHQFDLVSHVVEQVICLHGEGHIHVHPTAEITADSLYALYGSHVRLVRHATRLEGRSND